MREPSSLTAQVAEELRGRLMAGTIAAGTRINEAELAHELGISRGPVREAVRQLSSEGMLVHRANHGAAAPTLETADITAVFDLRAALECHAVELAAARITAEEITELRRQCQTANSSWHEGSRFPFALDLEFHSSLLAAARSPLIQQHGRLAHQRVIQLRACLSLPSTQHTQSSIHDHERITDALERGDADTARAVMKDHIALVADQLHTALDLSRPTRGDEHDPDRG